MKILVKSIQTCYGIDASHWVADNYVVTHRQGILFHLRGNLKLYANEQAALDKKDILDSCAFDFEFTLDQLSSEFETGILQRIIASGTSWQCKSGMVNFSDAIILVAGE